jgi:hypothetical protein
MDRSLPDPFDLGPPDPADSQTTLVADATRRSCLRGVLAVGLLPVMPTAVTAMMDSDLERIADLQLAREPLHFLVDSGGALELANWLPGADRASAYDVRSSEVDRLHDGFFDLLDRIEALRCEIWNYRAAMVADGSDQDGDAGGWDDSDWDAATIADLLDGLAPDQWAALRAHLLAWFKEDVRWCQTNSNQSQLGQ